MRRLHVGLHRLLRCALPRRLRRLRGADMEATFIDLLDNERRRRGWRGSLGVWVNEAPDLVRTSVSLRLRQRPSADAADAASQEVASARHGMSSGSPGKPPIRSGYGIGPDALIRDLRVGLRSLRKNPGFTAIAVISLAVGIGANTALFSVVNALFIRDYPFEDPQELVRIYSAVPGREPHGSTSYPDVIDMRSLDDVFAGVGVFDMFFSAVDLGNETVRVAGESISQSLFPMLGIDAAVGRVFRPEEDETPGTHPVALLGYRFWERSFSADPGVVGETIRLAGEPFTVVGVAPEWLQSLTTRSLAADIFVPYMMSAVTTPSDDDSRFRNRDNRNTSVMARLKDGVSLEAAELRLQVLAEQLGDAYPETNEGRSYRLVSDGDVVLAPDIDTALNSVAVFLMTVVGLVLLLACTNLATFLLARGTDRRKEIAVRLALGARRGTLMRMLLTETMLIALVGGVAGLLLAQWILSVLMSFHPPLPITFTLDLDIDTTVLLFTLGIASATGLLFGLAPALQSTRPAVAPTLSNEAGTGRRQRFGLRNCLIAVQVALSMVLLVGGGLFLRSLSAAQNVDTGFSLREAGIVYLDMAASRIPRSEYGSMTRELTERAVALPGVDAVTVANDLPLALGGSNFAFVVPGVEPPPGADYHRTPISQIDTAYLETMEISLVSGRNFTEQDRPGAPRVIMVSEEAARRYWPGESAVGKTINARFGDRGYRVVGVVSDVKVETLGEAPRPLLYFPLLQGSGGDLYIVARGRPEATEIAALLRAMLRETDPRLVVMATMTMEDNLSVVLFPSRMAALLLGTFGALALGLATIGLYGVVSFAVSRRTREVGIRMSLGANAGSVIGLVLRGAMAVVTVGGLIGLVLAFGLARLIGQYLIGVAPGDPVTFVGVPLLLASVALFAALVPARRASRIDPIEALRKD